MMMKIDLTASKRWFREARLGAFIHWGLYAIPGGIWKGKEAPYLAEWLQSSQRIPYTEYARLAEQFNPQGFDADQLVKAFADAGMRYIVFTAKHHEGFAMWHSQVSPFNSYNATPAHRDFVAEWSAACQRHGVKLGLYYSHCLDWHEPNGGDPRPCPDNFGMSWGNDWDFPDQSAKNFDQYFEGKVIPQLTELLTNYGPVAVLWLDCPMRVITPQHAQRILELVHALQPKCLVNSRLCSVEPLGDYGSLGDNQLPAGTTAEDFPREAIITLNDSWGYKSTDHHWKSPEQVQNIILNVLQSGANLLVNFGPDGNGRLTPESWDVLRGLAQWNPLVTEALHSSGQMPFPQDLGWARAVAADRRLWIFPREDAPDTALLAGVAGSLKTSSGAEVTPDAEDVWRLNGLKRLAEQYAPVMMEFQDQPHYDARPRIQNDRMVLLPTQAKLVHGDTAANACQQKDGPIGAAGEQFDQSKHSLLAGTGALTNWHNPADRCVWTIYLEPGRYQLRLITRNCAHSQPWHGDRVVELTIGDQRIEMPLVASQHLDDSPYYLAAATNLGEVSITHGGELDLTLRTLQLLSPEAAWMQLERIEVFRL